MPPDVDKLSLIGLEQILAVESQFAGGGLDEAGEAAHQCRFAGSREAHDDEDFAFAHIERGVAHRTDQRGLVQLGGGCLAVVPSHEFDRVGAEDLPQVTAR